MGVGGGWGVGWGWVGRDMRWIASESTLISGIFPNQEILCLPGIGPKYPLFMAFEPQSQLPGGFGYRHESRVAACVAHLRSLKYGRL